MTSDKMPHAKLARGCWLQVYKQFCVEHSVAWSVCVCARAHSDSVNEQ